uniref:Uncharacterized protein n=1 Tax=Cacopsylla melanoneura TaxID=428564 RepID=A0A8D8WN05_9HEMI
MCPSRSASSLFTHTNCLFTFQISSKSFSRKVATRHLLRPQFSTASTATKWSLSPLVAFWTTRKFAFLALSRLDPSRRTPSTSVLCAISVRTICTKSSGI